MEPRRGGAEPVPGCRVCEYGYPNRVIHYLLYRPLEHATSERRHRVANACGVQEKSRRIAEVRHGPAQTPFAARRRSRQSRAVPWRGLQQHSGTKRGFNTLGRLVFA